MPVCTLKIRIIFPELCQQCNSQNLGHTVTLKTKGHTFTILSCILSKFRLSKFKNRNKNYFVFYYKGLYEDSKILSLRSFFFKRKTSKAMGKAKK